MIEKFQKQLQVGGWLMIAVLALAVVWLAQNINQESETGNVSDTITVSGTGDVLAKPDIAVADIAISVEGATAKIAQNDASKKSVAVVDYLKKAGIKEADIKTSSYNIYPQYDYTNGRSAIRGYQVTQSLTVKVRDLDKANDIIDGVVTAGANQVNSFSFQIDNPDKLKAEARKKAIEEANTKAKELADELDIDLGHIVSFSESGNDYYPLRYSAAKEAMGMGGASSVPSPDLPTGENEVTVNVSITYQIK
jgi:uncharacterized protein